MPHLEIVSRVAGVAVRQGTRNPGQSDAYLNTAGITSTKTSCLVRRSLTTQRTANGRRSRSSTDRIARPRSRRVA